MCNYRSIRHFACCALLLLLFRFLSFFLYKSLFKLRLKNVIVTHRKVTGLWVDRSVCFLRGCSLFCAKLIVTAIRVILFFFFGNIEHSIERELKGVYELIQQKMDMFWQAQEQNHSIKDKIGSRDIALRFELIQMVLGKKKTRDDIWVGGIVMVFFNSANTLFSISLV